MPYDHHAIDGRSIILSADPIERSVPREVPTLFCYPQLYVEIRPQISIGTLKDRDNCTTEVEVRYQVEERDSKSA